ncbi:50S ribosomal protein L13 [Candidatus Woesebacteria bacterium]|nr:50S ribosomal protein L13 [Candidatus Woesebacteria bacterium]
MKKTYMQKTSEVVRHWHLVDVADKILGVVASDIAQTLIGKRKKEYTPHIDGGDFVVVINAAKVAVTGAKRQSKMYYRHSNFPGGLKQQSFAQLIESKPEDIIALAVKNMLPKNKLRDQRMARLKIYPSTEHRHQGQLSAEMKESTK